MCIIDRLKSHKSLVLLLLSVFIVMLVFTSLSPLCADDYDYSFSISSGFRIDSFYEIFKSMEVHRDRINGRYFSHFFAMFFLWMPKIVFNFANALMSVGLVYLVYRYLVVINPERSVSFTALWIMILFCFVPVFGQLFLWLDGACNYLWAMVFSLLYLYSFHLLWFDQFRSRTIVGDLVFIAEAFLAGSYSETYSLAVLIISFFVLVVKTVRKKIPDKMLYLYFLSACGGFLFLFLAPSTLRSRGKLSLPRALGVVMSLLQSIPPLYYVLSAVCILFAVLLIFLLRKRKRLMGKLFLALSIAGYAAACLLTAPDLDFSSPVAFLSVFCSSSHWGILTVGIIYLVVFILAVLIRTERSLLFLSLFYLLASAATVVAFLFARYIPARSFAPYSTFLTLSTVMTMAGMQKTSCARQTDIFKRAVTILFVVHFFLASYDIAAIHRLTEERLSLISQARLSMDQTAVIPMWKPLTKYSAPYGLDDVKESPDGWPNGSMRDYYGIDTIIGYEF